MGATLSAPHYVLHGKEDQDQYQHQGQDQGLDLCMIVLAGCSTEGLVVLREKLP